MHIKYDVFHLHQEGNRPEEYEDAYAATYTGLEPVDSVVSVEGISFDQQVQTFQCAVSDGATGSSFSGEWAQILAKDFVSDLQNKNDFISSSHIQRLRKEWNRQIEIKTQLKPLPWYAQEKLQQGAYATLMGLTIEPNYRWKAIWVGDSCLLVKHDNCWKKYWPAQFTNHPTLISTNAISDSQLTIHKQEGTWQKGDNFYLMTDALGDYLMGQRSKQSPLDKLTQSQEHFRNEIHHLWEEKQCKNDDVTLVKIAVTN